MGKLLPGLVVALSILGVADAADEVHMLVPGFTVEELPVEIPNINNIRFAPDGLLTALGYNGKVWKLRDADGDGLEDAVSVWWDRAPLTVPVGMCWSTRGLFVSSSGRVSLFRDTDDDDVADTEDVIASDWPDKDVSSGNVDATGVTMDADGNLYFGLLTADYANPYRLKKVLELSEDERRWLTGRGNPIPADPDEQVSLYDVNGMRGSVQKWNAKTRRLETIATGVRVPYSFAINKAGDLFMSDQEGETWCPDGNPLDELNHIVSGRNYGFPPPHRRWLPDLVSEPPVVAFGPQHQSTCGFVFNEPHAAINAGVESGGGSIALPASARQGLFGPEWWEGDAIVTGESRGKLWRVRLVKTDHGYVGTEFMIARLPMLTTDVAISPSGDLYVSCHSGLPDWGTGPNGRGKIFRIRYTDHDAPQPMDVSVVDGNEIRVEFDRPLGAGVVDANRSVEVRFGASVRAADRFEVLKPPYAVVSRQEAERRGVVAGRASHLSDQGRVLHIVADSRFHETHHAFSLKGIRSDKPGAIDYPVDLEFDLGGGGVPGSDDEWNGAGAGVATVDKPRGDYETGRGLFFGDRLQCATCHRIRGGGGGRGPDLSNLDARDVASVVRDIRDPSAALNPDYVGYDVVLKNGDVLSGFVRRVGNNQVGVTLPAGAETVVAPAEIAEMRPTGVSLMPPGLLDSLDDPQVNDLLTFLMNRPPERTPEDLRSIAETVESAGAADERRLKIVLVASEQDHGEGQHDYPAWQKSWHALLSEARDVEIVDAWLWPTADDFAAADAIVFYYWNHAWDDAKYAQLDGFQERGGGLVVLHSATIEDNAPAKLGRRIGLAAQPATVRYRHMPFDLHIVDGDHPITSGLPETIRFIDEPYWPMIGDLSAVHVLANAVDVDGADRPMMWTIEKGGGRVFASIAGHYTWTLDDPYFRRLVLRGLDWVTHSSCFGGLVLSGEHAAGLPNDR